MTKAPLRATVQHVRHLVTEHGAADQTDGDLLRAFVDAKDPRAFAQLVKRHGPLVLSVCRRLLRHEQDAEDAFQATFLVLLRKAASVRRHGALASWLHGVAYRVAADARKAAARRRQHEKEVRPPGLAPAAARVAAAAEVETILDEEVRRLPVRYRGPFILCCLEGRSCAEVARWLCQKEGTVWSRVARARARLRQRLARRGVSLGVVPGAITVPALLAGSTVEAAALLAAAPGLATAHLAPNVASLLQRVSRVLFLSKRAAAALVFLTVGLMAAGLILASALAPAVPQKAAEPPAAAAPAGPHTDRHGDALPAGAVARLGTIRFRGGGGPSWVAFLPGDATLATAAAHGVSFWDAATGKETRRLAQTGWAQAQSPDARILALLPPGDPTIHLWDVAADKEIRRLVGHQEIVRSVAFSADGRVVVSGGTDKTARVWEAATGKELRRFPKQDMILGVAVTPDGKTVAMAEAAGVSTVYLHDVATGKELHRFQGHMPIFHVLFAPNGKTLAAVEPINGGCPDSKVHLCDVATGRLRQLPPLPEYIWGAAFSPDGKFLATANQEQFRVWDVATLKPLDRFAGNTCYTVGLAFARDGKTLATQGDTTIRQWDVATGKEVRPTDAGHRGAVPALAFLPGDKSIVTAGRDGTLRLWEAATGKELGRFRGPHGNAEGSSFSADGRTLAARAGNGVDLWAADAARGPRHLALPNLVYHVALTPDGKTLAVWGRDRKLRLVDAGTGKEGLTLLRHREAVAGLAFSPGGDVLAVAVEDDTVRLMDVSTGAVVHRLSPSAVVEQMTFSADGRVLATPDGQAIRLWEVATGRERGRLPDRARGEMAFSPDGKVLAVGDDGGDIRLYDVATGAERGRLRGHGNRITCLAFSAQGTTLASGSWDTTALVWDVSGLLRPLRRQAEELGPRQLEALWADLAGEDAVRAYQAVRRLAASPQEAVPYLRQRVRPAATVPAERLARLIAELDSDAFAVRERAAAALEELGEAALPACRAVLNRQPSAEVRRRLTTLVEQAGRARWAVPAGRLGQLRALEAVELADGEQARLLLEEWSRGLPGASLTEGAKAALEHRARRSGAAP
jgi:RNA polymerase sigma factor (sigma-70 family)